MTSTFSNLTTKRAAVILATIIVVFACWLNVRLYPNTANSLVLENAHWTLAFIVGAWIAWRGYRESPKNLTTPKFYQFISLLCLAIGQLIWNVQTYLNWTPFPGPSDLFFFPSTFILLISFLMLVPREKRVQISIDIAGFALGAAVLTLTLYLPEAESSNPFQLFVLSSYPIGLLSASACFVVLQLHGRQRWNLSSSYLALSICALGFTWMSWNLGQLKGDSQSGSYTNLSFSLTTLVVGWTSYLWKLNTDNSLVFDRFCEGVLRQLPLIMVALTTATLGLLVFDGRVIGTTRLLLVFGAFMVLVFAVYRQTKLLAERDLLIEVERALFEGQKKFQHLAHHDPLTGLPNLTLLRDRVSQAIELANRNQTKIALMFIDLDHFKEINDTLGHEAGDILLRTIAEQFQNLLRTTDTVSRQGGDEFSIVLSDVVDVSQVTNVAEKLLYISRQHTTILGHEIPTSFSTGIALYPDDARDFPELMRCADTAMYKAKAAGGHSYVFYDAKMNDEASSRMRIRMYLSRAIERSELSLNWQVQIDLSSGEVTGAEALVRWDSLELGRVPPSTFISIAEDSGLIVPIGEWILNEACQQASKWLREGLFVPSISVNVSMVQFIRGNIEQQIADALYNSDLDPSFLKLEITESVLMHDPARVLQIVDRILKLGVRLSIDDFGTGYSSLAYVQRLKVDSIKIDQSFVREIPGNSSSCAIAKAVIDMAKAMDMTVVAEGVETEMQRDFLRENGCEIGQGYFFSKPQPECEFQNLLRSRARFSSCYAIVQ
ncbi:putative bifunctional diguanylate cyclase/phosphodiesterase [Undibacterium sp. Di24W]|uniref:putative bifunctional diguanylate cyclase/phosphodiesterase n=1 Tax=Undibacterium sp. Di24W TaxID=3413033 RepID=UPI003BF2AD21